MTKTQDLIAYHKKMFGKHPPQTRPAAFNDLIVGSLHALSLGEATPHQQKTAIQWIINHAARTHGVHYRSESARDSDFAMGRAFVGQQIIELLGIPMIDLAPDITPPENTENLKQE